MLKLLSKACSMGKHHLCPRWNGKGVPCDCRCGHN